MDERSRQIYLADIYGGLLTEKQQNILNSYLNEDMSISEIAREENISRPAAFDLLKRSEKLLEDYDEKLGLFERYLRNRELIGKIRTAVPPQGELEELFEELLNNI